ncbi:MAG: histidine kinase [Gemmatimonadales bacterium]
MTSRRLASVLLVSSFGTLALVSSMQGYFARRSEGEPTGIFLALAMGMSGWLVWLIVAPAIVALGRIFDFRPRRRILSLVVHLPAAVVALLVTTLPSMWLGYVLMAPGKYPGLAVTLKTVATSSRLTLTIFIYATIIGLDRALHLWQALQERELQATRLEAQATRARLEALGARLQPHFLFNTLQSVSALVDTDPPRARTMLAQLGDLLRDVLDDSARGEVTLADEIALLERYLEIERTRFADRVRIEVSIPPDTALLQVPRFLLQPLAENALRHGLAPRAAGGTLRITARRDGARLHLRVWNNGLALSPGATDGVGLATTRERLSTRYGSDATLRLTPSEGGVEAVIDLPATSAT